MKTPEQKSMTHIGSILAKSLAVCRNRADADMIRIWDIWDGAVGEAIAQNARPSAFKGHMLQVNVSSSAWLYHLNFLKNELMDKLNTALGAPLVRELTFKIGPVAP